jgi:hypothetical protein
MKISEKKKQQAYDAINDPIISLRVKNASGISVDDIELFKLEQEIWRRLKTALNFTDL